jgi:hypothetical protein
MKNKKTTTLLVTFQKSNRTFVERDKIDTKIHDRSISFLHFYLLHYQKKLPLQTVTLQSTF